MAAVARSVVHFLTREDGLTAVECALMLALVVIVCIVALNTGRPDLGPREPVIAVVP